MQAGDKLTKIVATLGPATSSLEVIKQLIMEGVDVFRINFSHGDLSDYEQLLHLVREASRQTGRHAGVLGDLPGPKIRIGQVAKKGIMLEPGQTVLFSEKETMAEGGSPLVFSTNYPSLLKEIKPGERILIDDGNVELVCRENNETGEGTMVSAEVITGGLVTTRKGLNLPDSELSLPSLTPRDEELIAFAAEKGFDFLALSFVRTVHDVRALKKKLQKLGVRPAKPSYQDDYHPDNTILEGTAKGFIPIISKIEKPQAVTNLVSILKETDMVMVARGDLGVEMDLAEIAVIQKNIIRQCRDYGVPVIVATQMLQSMIENATPTRAEVSDVANAIFDGADAVMLSGETAVGKFPVEAVRVMSRVAQKTDAHIRETHQAFDLTQKLSELRYRSTALANGVKTMVSETAVDFIGVWSELGGSAVFLSQCRIPQVVFAFSPDARTVRLLSILYGIRPVIMSKPKDTLDFMLRADQLALENEWAKTGDTAIYISREPIDQVGHTNQVNLHFIGKIN